VTTSSPYASRPWLKHYDYWVRPNMTYPGRPLSEILAATAIDIPDWPATSFFGAELTFLDLKRRSDAFAAALAGLGIAKGDRVAIMLPNCPQYIIAAFGILRLGAVVVNINPSYTAREVLVVLKDSGARGIVTLDALAPLVAGIRGQTPMEWVIITTLSEYMPQPIAAPTIPDTLSLTTLISERGQTPVVASAPGELAVLQYTGGTTGTPKGAMLTHANIFANVIQT